MSIRKRFNEVFRVEDNAEEEKKRFVERINHRVFHAIDTQMADDFNYHALFRNVCYEMGVDANDRGLPPSHTGVDEYLAPSLETLTEGDFGQGDCTRSYSPTRTSVR